MLVVGFSHRAIVECQLLSIDNILKSVHSDVVFAVSDCSDGTAVRITTMGETT